MPCGPGTLQHNVGPDKDIKNLNRGYCDTPNCVDLIVYMYVVQTCVKSHIRCLIGLTSRFEV